MRKYRNRPVETKHGKFDSAGEARRFDELVLLEKAGYISDLRRQVRLDLHGRDGVVVYPSKRVAHVVVDYAYIESGSQYYEDFKGHQTDMSKLQHAVLAAQGIKIKITRGVRR